MKELSQIRMAVLDALRGAGIQAMEVFPEKQAMAYSGVVAAVGVGAASGKTAGFCHYLGEMKDPETQAVRERYGKELFGQITVELRANRAADCERGCETATEVLLGGLPEGVRTGELTWEAICWEKPIRTLHQGTQNSIFVSGFQQRRNMIAVKPAQICQFFSHSSIVKAR